MKTAANVFVLLFVFTVPVFHYSPTADFAEEYFGVEACTDDMPLGLGEAAAGEAPVLFAHGGGLNKCGCHFNRKTGECHCHQDKGCGCECQPSRCN